LVEKKVTIQCGECNIIIDKDEKGRPSLTPECPPDEKGQPVLSEEAKALKDVMQSPEVVLNPAKIKQEE